MDYMCLHSGLRHVFSKLSMSITHVSSISKLSAEKTNLPVMAVYTTSHHVPACIVCVQYIQYVWVCVDVGSPGGALTWVGGSCYFHKTNGALAVCLPKHTYTANM